MLLCWQSSNLVTWFQFVKQDKAKTLPSGGTAWATKSWLLLMAFKMHGSHALQANPNLKRPSSLLSQDTWQNLTTPPTHHSLPPQSCAPPRRDKHRVWASLEFLNHQAWSAAGQPQPQTQVEDFIGPSQAWKNRALQLESAVPENRACSSYRMGIKGRKENEGRQRNTQLDISTGLFI